MKYSLSLFLFATFAAAQTTELPTGTRLTPPGDIPAIVKEKFRIQHPAVNATWKEVDGSRYEAAFLDDSTRLAGQAWYSSTGELLLKRGQLDKGGYPAVIDEYYFMHHPTNRFVVWKEEAADAAPYYFGISGRDTLWFGSNGEYHLAKNKARNKATLGEQDRGLLLDIAMANASRMAMLFHVTDSSKVLGKEKLASRFSEAEQVIRGLAEAKGTQLPEPFMPAAKSKEPTLNDFKKLNKRFMKVVQKAKKKSRDADLKALAKQLLTIETANG